MSDIEQHRGRLMETGPDFTRRRVASHSLALTQETDDRVGVETRQYLLDDGSFWESHIEHNDGSITCEWHQIVPPTPKMIVPEEAELITKLRQNINDLIDERDDLRRQLSLRPAQPVHPLEPWRVLVTARNLAQMKVDSGCGAGWRMAWLSLLNQLNAILREFTQLRTQPYELKK